MHRFMSLTGAAAAFWLPLSAAGLSLDDYHARGNDTLDLYLSGSSAQDSTLQRLFRLICEPRSLDVYRSENGSVRVFFCSLRSGLPDLPGALRVAFHKSSIGGSGSGVGPLIERTPVGFLSLAGLRGHLDERCPKAKRVVHPAEGVQIEYTEYECSNPTPDLQVPDAGISDVEPRFFLNAYHLAPDAVDGLTVRSANAFIFGVPVSIRLRDALQAARFPTEDPCNPANPHYSDLTDHQRTGAVMRGETEPCMPSLSRAQLAGIFAGTVGDWSQILTPKGFPLAARSPKTGQIGAAPGVAPPSDTRVFICRRVPTSGTQAAFEMFFLNQRCVTGVPAFVETGNNVFQGSVTSDVENCLSQLDRQNLWAVGIMTTETVESSTSSWRFIKMDGVAPTLLNAFNGRWPFFVEQSYQWRNEHSERPLQGAKLALMTQIGQQLGNRTIIRDLDRGFRHAWGSAGLMALGTSSNAPPLAQPGRPVDSGVIEEDPVLAVHHAGSNCSAVVAQYPTALP